MKIFIVIPAFNEEQTIGGVVESLREIYDNIVVVDDGSDDGTSYAASQAGASTVRHIINRGQGASLKTGINYALQHKADIVVTFDADGQHTRQDITRLIQPIIEQKAEVVLGSRFLEDSAINIPTTRKLMLKAAVIFTRFMSRLKVTDTHNGLRALSRVAADRIRIKQDRMAHASEILDEIYHKKLKYVEVPVTIKYSDYSTHKGQSSLSFGKILVKYMLGRIIK